MGKGDFRDDGISKLIGGRFSKSRIERPLRVFHVEACRILCKFMSRGNKTLVYSFCIASLHASYREAEETSRCQSDN